MKICFNANGNNLQEWILNPNQEAFMKCDKKYVAYVGGRGGGKSLALVLKLIQLLLQYPKNYGLLGRYNYSDLRDTTVKDFFDICPEEYIKRWSKQEKQVTFQNGSTLIFRGLKDVKKTEVRSLNLGFFALEQAEEIDEGLFNELSACMRRKLVDFDGKEGKQQAYFLANPALNWIFRKAKQEKNEEWELVPCSMMDNAANLPDSFLQDQLAKPESWKRVFVYGEFDENILAGRAVFAQEYVIEQNKHKREKIRSIDNDIYIYREVQEGHSYQMGIDPSEGANDSSVIKVVDINTGEEVARYRGKIQPDLLGLKVVKLGDMYNSAKAVLEINGIGLATLTKLKELNYENIYLREEFDRQSKVLTKKLGWRTTHTSKPLLVGYFQELLNKKRIKIRDEQTIQEMKTFVYSEDAARRGMGAEKGFHDDLIMAHMLACWNIKPGEVEEGDFVVRPQEGTAKGILDRLHLQNILNVPRQKGWLEQ